MSDAFIQVRNLKKHFGKVKAVDGVSFEMQKGKVMGFIGANGAGKTTTLRIMATLETPDAGGVVIDGVNAHAFPSLARSKIGWMPDEYGHYKNLSVSESLTFFASAFGYRGEERRQRVQEVIEFTEITELADRMSDKLSKGQSQRLCLARALLNDPEILLLDEPAAGLDPKARMDFKRLVRILAERGHCLLISSHILGELEEMCDDLLFINKGKIVHCGSADSLRSARGAVSLRVLTEGTPQDFMNGSRTIRESTC